MLSTWLNRPFPHITDSKLRWATALGVGLVVFLFLSVYKPFGIAEVKAGSWYVLGFGGCVATSLLVLFYTLPFISKQVFNSDTWTIKTEILFHLFNLILTASLNYFYNSTVGADISPQHNWPAFIYITLAVGIFPIILMVYGSEKYLAKSNTDLASTLDINHSSKNIAGQHSISIVGDNDSEAPLILDQVDFIYAQSDNNYCTIYYQDQGNTKQRLIRISLKNILSAAGASSTLLRCHKSYVINKSKIVDITGNARSLQLQLADTDAIIPVSRTLDRSVLSN